MTIKQVFAYYYKEDHHQISEYKYCQLCQTKLVLIGVGHKIRPMCSNCGFVHYQNPSPVVSVFIVENDSVLLGKRGEEPGKGKWAMPSGHIEYEHDFITTAILEAKEETGLDIEVQTISNVITSYFSPKYHFIVVYLKALVVGGELEAGDDLEEVRWVRLSEDLPEMAFDEDVEMLGMYASGELEELPIETKYACQVDI